MNATATQEDAQVCPHDVGVQIMDRVREAQALRRLMAGVIDKISTQTTDDQLYEVQDEINALMNAMSRLHDGIDQSACSLFSIM